MLFSQPNFVSSSFAMLSADASTTSTTFVGFLSQSINIASSNDVVNVFFSGAVSTATGAAIASFQVYIDGVAQTGTAAACDPNVGSNSVIAITSQHRNLSVANHTFEIRWKTSASTLRVRPATNPTLEHASLIVIKTRN